MKLPDGVRRLFRVDHDATDVSRSVREELADHLDRVAEEHRRGGLSPERARELADQRFGDVGSYRRKLEKIGRRGLMRRRREEVMEGLWTNVVLASRGIARRPGFALGVISILGLGMGANAVMFGVVDRLLLSPPRHVVEHEDVGRIHVRRQDPQGEPRYQPVLTYPDYADLREVGAFESVGAYSPARMTLGHGDTAEQVDAVLTSSSLFSVLGVVPARGRFFALDDTRPGAPLTAVLSHELWERRYGADPSVIGQALDIDEGRFTVVGVAPPGFTGAELAPVDVWLPLEPTQQLRTGVDLWREHRNWWWVRVVARIASTVTREGAEAEATAAHRAGRAELIAAGDYDGDAEVVAASIIAGRGPEASEESRVTRWLAGVSLIVLLIACFNVANLLLARSIRRRRDLAVRMALGGSRSRLASLLLTESLLLTGLGAAAAFLLALWGGPTLHRVLLPDVAFYDPALDGRLLAFLGAMTVLTGLVAGVVPALRGSRPAVADALKGTTHGIAGGRSRVRMALTLAQAAFSVILLVGAGLFVRSLANARALDLGWEPDRVAVVSFGWDGSLPALERSRIYREALERARRLPEVRAASPTYVLPFRGSIVIGAPRVPGLVSFPSHPEGGPYVNKVGSGYFETMGLTILQGRGFEPADDLPGATPVTVVTQSMARAVWPRSSPIGRCLHFTSTEDSPCTEVVGVVSNLRREQLVEENPHHLAFLNLDHPDFEGPPQALLVGSRRDASALVPPLRAAMRTVSPQIRFADVHPLQDHVDPKLQSWRLGASMFTAFGLLALVVAAWGLYSVLAFDVALRRRELGVRAALGAGRPRLVLLVLRQALALVALGVVMGSLFALVVSGYVRPLLFQVSPRDPRVYLVVALTLLAVAALAGSLPAWQATRADPRSALRAE